MGKIEEEILDNIIVQSNLLGDLDSIQKVLDLTSDTLLVLDEHNRCVEYLLKSLNPFLNINADIIGKNFLEILPAETAVLLKEDLEHTRNTGLTSNFSYDIPTDERVHYFKLTIHKFNDKYLLCQYRDITKRSNIKSQLRSAAVALMEVGRVAKILHWSYDYTTDIISYPDYSTQEDIIFLDSHTIPLSLYLTFIHEDDREVVRRFLQDRSDNSLTIEYRLIREGHPIEYFRSTRYEQQEDQNVVSGFTQNVTDFMKNRHELEMLVTVVQKSPRSVLAAKNDGEVIFINKMGRRLNGLGENHNIRGINIKQILPEFSTADKWFAFKERLKHSQDGYRFRIKAEHLNSDILETECIATIIKNWQGEDIIWFFQQDISDQIRYQEQLLKSKEMAVESEKLKMAFISNMNHEIRTPLSAIIGLSMLIADTDESDLRHEYAKLITTNSDQLLRLITDVLEMSRLDTGNMSLIPKSESLNQLMQELKLSFEHVKDRAVLKISIPTEDTIAYLDKGRLMQVLTNMVNNSRKFTPETGLIEVGYRIINSRIELFVKDNGKGIPKEKQKDIFNRFFKVNEGDVGTGLGLAISKSIVDQMNGFIQVESEEGKGTAFYISLPLMTEPAVN